MNRTAPAPSTPAEFEAEYARLGAKHKAELESDLRRKCTSFGYRHDGHIGMAGFMLAVTILTALTVAALALIGLNPVVVTAPIPVGAAGVVAAPFLFLKPRYALPMALGALAIFVALGALVWLRTAAVFGSLS